MGVVGSSMPCNGEGFRMIGVVFVGGSSCGVELENCGLISGVQGSVRGGNLGTTGVSHQVMVSGLVGSGFGSNGGVVQSLRGLGEYLEGL